MTALRDEEYTDPAAQCIFVCGLLAHPINVGYGGFYSKRLESMNGVS